MQIFANEIFENPINIISAFDNESFIRAFSQIEDLRKRPSIYLLGYIRYEAKDIFLNKKIQSDLPLLYFEVYDKKSDFEFTENNKNLSIKSLIPVQSFDEYKKAIKFIKEEIAKGNTYEVNYTYSWKLKADTEGLELFKSILPEQNTPFSAYIKNEHEEILSFSPELFFTLSGNKIFTKPMKGTIKRGKTEKEDLENIEFLKNDIKNRAENVMIVDLLRNDLGKIAKTASVKVDKLFDIETHKTLHQMTSEISAELEYNTTLFNIFEAIFPCGSITGAPKISTMNIIEQVEKRKRGVYCGAIGMISKEKTIFSVPIRTLQKRNSEKNYEYGVGGAIVWDSDAKEEWDETLVKMNFLTPKFSLIETMLIKNRKIVYEKEHLKRMKNSAKILGFSYPEKIKFNTNLPENGILRLILDLNGDFQVQIKNLDNQNLKKVLISNDFVNSKDPLLYHKTTHRPWYQKTMEKIAKNEVFDEIFFNEKGELTEGARSNIVLKIDGNFYTSPVKCGLLNGILRQKMINDGKIIEKVLYKNDLFNAEKIYCINSIRGKTEVELG